MCMCVVFVFMILFVRCCFLSWFRFLSPELMWLFCFSNIQRATQAAAGIFQHLEKFSLSMANAKGSAASAAAPDAPFERLGLLL